MSPAPARSPQRPDRSQPSAEDPRALWRFVFRLLSRHRREFVLALLWSIVFVLVPMQVPLLTGALVSGVTGQAATFYGILTVTDRARILSIAVVGLLLTAGAYGLTAYLSTASVSELSRTFVSGLRKEMIRKLNHASTDVHERFGSGELLSRVIVDTQSTRTFVQTVFFTSIQSVVRIAYPVAILFLLSPVIALCASAILPIQYALTRHLQRRLRLATRTARTSQGHLTALVKEDLDGIESIQTLNAEELASARLAAQTDRLARDQIAVKALSGMISGSTWALTSLGVALTWWLGGLDVMAGTMSLGTLVAVTGFVVLLYTPMRRFTSIANVYQRGLVAFERIREVLDSPSAIRDDPSAPPLRVSDGVVEFRRVSFSYGRRPVLSDVSIELQARSLNAVVGRNGAGKSTLLRLLARQYDPTQGEVRVDGQDLRRVRLASLRAQIAVVPQRPTVFTGNVLDNVRLGRPDASLEEVHDACRKSGALEFIARMPRGFHTPLGPGGNALSGGEAQRLAIARALLRRPKILVLDEPNSALDTESEQLLLRTLNGLKGQMTVVVVAHHLDALMASVDRVVVVDPTGSKVGAAPARDAAPLPAAALAGEV